MPKITVYELQHRKGAKFNAILCDSRSEVMDSVEKFLALSANGDEEERSLTIIRTMMDKTEYDKLPDWDGGK